MNRKTFKVSFNFSTDSEEDDTPESIKEMFHDVLNVVLNPPELETLCVEETHDAICN